MTTSSINMAKQGVNGVKRLLGNFDFDPRSSYPEEIQQAIYLARVLQERAIELQTPEERRQQAELDRMIHNPGDKETLMKMTDQAFRASRPGRAAEQLIHILDVQGIPRFFSTFDRTMLMGFQSFGGYLPGVAMPFVKDKMRSETANVVLPAEPEVLRKHLLARRAEGVRMNVNYLGEALLGEEEAKERLAGYLSALERAETEVVSVKISTLYSQISPLSREHTVAVLVARIAKLYQKASSGTFTRQDGTVVPKFVYMDMEEYRDKGLTAAVFMQALDLPEMKEVQAGIVLQAYVPDSFETLQEINAWARKRVSEGGGEITIRLVKGANMEMERVEASLQGWPQAPYQKKIETDANYMRMLHEAMRPENLAAVRVGIASHNLFTLAYGLVLAVKAEALERVQFEMLEGMANHQRRALFELSNNMLLYAPACKQEDFIYAIGYLVRRLDENTGPDNFLRHAFNVTVGTAQWSLLEQQFADSFQALDTLRAAPRRTQDRNQPSIPTVYKNVPWQEFENEADTDWSLPQNGTWAKALVATWKERRDASAYEVPLVIGGTEVWEDREIRETTDASRVGVVVGRYRQASSEDIEEAVAVAKQEMNVWGKISPEERAKILYRVADELCAARGSLMGAAMAEGGKTLLESDPEVSEAVDFCRFYAQTARTLYETTGLTATGQGVVAVVSPWNFPIAIPCGGIAAALAAGNTVILKPASDTVLIAYEMCLCFWRAGVSKSALQFVPCSGAVGGSRLVSHDGVEIVILTGGTETAQRMLATKPTMKLFAETGGKNGTVVTSLSDRDQVIKNVLQSAFGHAGQKCSATSLLILEEEVYNDPKFKASLCDAVQSLTVGSAWDLETKMGPLVRAPEGDLLRALTTLEEGESWAVEPQLCVGGNACQVTPGVKWGVQPGSYTHMTEFFGPVLGVMSAKNLEHAISLVNQTGFGLTSGIESLDEREIKIWKEAIKAGNLYVNRSTTGAIVLRQPFGGMGKSVVGPGIKAGGPNYVAQFMNFTVAPSDCCTKQAAATVVVDELLSNFKEAILRELKTLEAGDTENSNVADLEKVLQAIISFDHWAQLEFLQEHDHMRLVGEDNHRRYRTVEKIRIRVAAEDTLFEIFTRVAAARAVGSGITVSSPIGLDSALVTLLDTLTTSWAGAIEFVEESDQQLADVLRAEGGVDRVRYAALSRVPALIQAASAETLKYIGSAPVSAHGRLELLWYVQEQSVTDMYHRYGNLGARGQEQRAKVM